MLDLYALTIVVDFVERKMEKKKLYLFSLHVTEHGQLPISRSVLGISVYKRMGKNGEEVKLTKMTSISALYS